MNVGGPSKHVVNLIDGLSNFGCQSLLVSGKPNDLEGNLYELARGKNIELRVIDYMERSVSPINDFLALVRIIKIIKKFKPDIIHTHTTKAGILGRLAALICSVPKIYHTYHGHVFSGYFNKLTSIAIIAIERFFSSFTTKIISLTPNLSNELRSILRPKNPEKIVTIPLGLDLKANYMMPRKSNKWRISMGFSNDDFILGIIARLVPVKNHALLINSMPVLAQRFPNLHLVIIGDGEMRNELELQVKELGLMNRIHFCGIIKNLETVYSDLDLLVLCSKNEGTPVSIIEALASGCPVSATSVGGVKELLENGRLGRLLSLEPKSFVEDLSDAIKDLKERKFKEIPNLKTRKYICDYYSVEKLVYNTFKVYRNKLEDYKP